MSMGESLADAREKRKGFAREGCCGLEVSGRANGAETLAGRMFS